MRARDERILVEGDGAATVAAAVDHVGRRLDLVAHDAVAGGCAAGARTGDLVFFARHGGLWFGGQAKWWLVKVGWW